MELIHVVVRHAAHMFVATAAALRAHGAGFFEAAAVAAVTAVVVVLIAFALFLAALALRFAVAATGQVVKKEHMFSPPLFYVNGWVEVFTLSVYAGKRMNVPKDKKPQRQYSQNA